MNKLLITLLSFSFCFSSFSVDVYQDFNVELPKIEKYSSPTERFMQIVPVYKINNVLQTYGASEGNISMFKQMIKNEKVGFFGYHGGSTDNRIFQDIIRIAIEVYLDIPIRENYHFLRTPGIPDFSYESAEAFIKVNPTYKDTLPHIRKHLLSINISLYSSWDAVWDFTPRYFLENQGWTYVQYESELAPFFKKLGVDPKYIYELFGIGHQHVHANTGFIIQFFDASHQSGDKSPYAFLNKHAFIGSSSTRTTTKFPSSLYINANDSFPQLRMLMSNKYSLNPNSPLIMLRYSTMPPKKQEAYEQALRDYMRALPFDQAKAEAFKAELLEYWNN